MAKTTTKKPTKASRTKKNKKASVEVKSITDVSNAVNGFIYKNFHDRYNVRLSEAARTQIVSYGPWIATVAVLVVLPQLMIFAHSGSFVSLSGFFNTVFFNQDSWVLLLVMLANLLLLVDGLSHIFNTKQRGWNRIYLAGLISTAYVLCQVLGNSQDRAAAVLSALLGFALLFVILDVRQYYK